MPRLGQKLSKESVDRMKQSKLDSLTSKYNWVLAEPYIDIEVKNGSVKRTTQYITLREFKENILSGLSIKDMISNGVSKNVLQFFSNFCQGKIKLTKELFEECYLHGFSLDRISKEFLVTREDLTCLRQLYGIKRKGATYINRKKTEEKLTQRQIALIYGSLMGDAKRNDKRYGTSVGFGHSDKQEDYLKWKYKELENLCNETSLKKYSSIDKRSGNDIISWRFYTKANTEIENIISQFYKEDKQITKEILDNLCDFSIAVWYMDDGTVNFFDGRIKSGMRCSPEIKLCTDSFSEESCNLIIEWFKEKWNINSHYRKSRGRVIIDSTSAQDFLSLVRPHVIPSMLYKVDYEEYKKWKNKVEK